MLSVTYLFQSTLPVGGATSQVDRPCLVVMDFNPRSPWGERPYQVSVSMVPGDFNPRSPWGERPGQPITDCIHRIFQSTLPVGGATPTETVQLWWGNISIHAPRGGSDKLPVWLGVKLIKEFQSTLPVGGATAQVSTLIDQVRVISIHAPRGGSDNSSAESCKLYNKCQSTLPVGGATRLVWDKWKEFCDFNPRSPWGERPYLSFLKVK